MNPGHLACLAVAIGTMACFAGAIPLYFRRGHQPMRGKRLLLLSILGCGTFQIVGLVRMTEVDWRWAAPGLFAFTCAHLLFWSAILAHGRDRPNVAFSADQPSRLATHGPYRWIRHPFYSAYTLAWLGSASIMADPVQLIPAALMFAIYYRAAVAEERGFLASSLAEDYSRYQQLSGMFLPRLRITAGPTNVGKNQI